MNYTLRMYTLKNALIIAFLFISGSLFSQGSATIKGKICEENGTPVFSATIGIRNLSIGTVCDESGQFTIVIPSGKSLVLVISHLGFKTVIDTIIASPRQVIQYNKTLYPETKNLNDVIVYGTQDRENTLVRIDLKSIDQLPNTSGNIETIIKTMPGVVSGNELSSQYSVRGGSFDENLIYVNEIEIYKPMLIQSAQQEGLSFVNPSMVSSIQFSAGGFDAQYGDKLSSVLDIKYTRATEFKSSVTASLLGGSAHFQNSGKNNKFSFNTGLRYKTTKYLLGTLDTRGDYQPSFGDIQSYITYDISDKIQLSFLGNYTSSKFNRTPHTRDTDFGAFQQSFNFLVYYDGHEMDHFENYMGAFTLNYQPIDKLSLKIIGGYYGSDEMITYDLLKEYWISEATESSSGQKDSLVNIGVGSAFDHARDYLESNIYTLEHRGSYYTSGGNYKWGIKLQKEIVSDDLNEWQLLDSAGFSLPYSDEEVSLLETYRSKNHLNEIRISSFLQHTLIRDNDKREIILTAGIRSCYWTYNHDLTISPRGNVTVRYKRFPNLTWHFATGLYYQPPFYKELRDPYGNLYPSKKAQRALHIVFGQDYHFTAWNRPFIFSSEIYYKYLTRIIPYKMEDVRLQYLPMYDKVKGYAAGIDFKIFGEFVPGSESWFSLSFLSTKEDIYNDYVVSADGTVTYPDYYRRPTDQFMSLSIFFQDYLPSNPNYKIHLMLIYGTGLPFSGPTFTRPSDIYKLGAYRRVDVGFSRVISVRKKDKAFIKSIWITGEILNLMDSNNKVSYDWIRTVENSGGYSLYFAVPNYLTGRTFNLKLSAYF